MGLSDIQHGLLKDNDKGHLNIHSSSYRKSGHPFNAIYLEAVYKITLFPIYMYM